MGESAQLKTIECIQRFSDVLHRVVSTSSFTEKGRTTWLKLGLQEANWLAMNQRLFQFWAISARAAVTAIVTG